jgi:hypothetical protein
MSRNFIFELTTISSILYFSPVIILYPVPYQRRGVYLKESPVF